MTRVFTTRDITIYYNFVKVENSINLNNMRQLMRLGGGQNACNSCLQEAVKTRDLLHCHFQGSSRIQLSEVTPTLYR